MYQGPIEYLFPDLHAKNSAVQDGGGESEYMVRLYSICENNGIHRQAESVYVPADRILMQQDLVTNTLRYGMHLSNLGTVWNGYLNLHSAEFAGTNRWNGGAVTPLQNLSGAEQPETDDGILDGDHQSAPDHERDKTSSAAGRVRAFLG